MRTAQKIRVMIVDDHYFVRLGLAECMHLEPDMEVVAEASNGEQALEQYRSIKPDVCLVDLALPGMSGSDFTNRLRQEFLEARVLIISTYQGADDIYRAFQSGAKGYLLKSMEPSMLIEGVRTVFGGQNYIPPAIQRALSERAGRPDLSPRETEVLHLIVKGHSNKEIASVLNITEGTVKLHVHKLLDKLGVADRTQAATRAIEGGFFRGA